VPQDDAHAVPLAASDVVCERAARSSRQAERAEAQQRQARRFGDADLLRREGQGVGLVSPPLPGGTKGSMNNSRGAVVAQHLLGVEAEDGEVRSAAADLFVGTGQQLTDQVWRYGATSG
jgi:hypothetical protein